jgi:hypothetical protein
MPLLPTFLIEALWSSFATLIELTAVPSSVRPTVGVPPPPGS